MNTIGQLFENQAGRSENLRAWKFIDLLEDAFSKTVSQLKDAPNDAAAGRIVITLLEQAEQKQITDSPQEHQALLSWLEGLLSLSV